MLLWQTSSCDTMTLSPLPWAQVLKHSFTFTDADQYVLKYMEANAEQFPLATIQSLQKKHGKLPA